VTTRGPDDNLKRSRRALRYGVAIGVVVVGVLCGAIIPGTLGGTICTAVVGIGLVGVVSLVFYDVGLTEDRDRARLQQRMDRLDRLEREEREQREQRGRRPDGQPAHPGEIRSSAARSRPRRSRMRDEHGRLN
jgi:hypothetical protein